MTKAPLIAIIGSVRREIVGADEAVAAGRGFARDLGAALAREGVRLAVYSSDPLFIEGDVVAGYLDALGDLGDGEVEVHAPLTLADGAGFGPERAASPERVRLIANEDRGWRSAFYQSLAGVDGAVLIGGGRTTLVSGGIALSRRLPVAAIPRFGGEAAVVWGRMKHIDAYDAGAVDAMAANAPDTPARVAAHLARWCREQREKEAAAAAVQAALRDKAERLDALLAAGERERRRTRLGWAVFAAFVAALAGGLTFPDWLRAWPGLLVVALALAGAAGAGVRMLWRDAPVMRTSASMLVGAMVGLVLGVLYLLPQWTGGAALAAETGALSIQVVTASVIALSFGFGFDAAADRLIDGAAGRASRLLGDGG